MLQKGRLSVVNFHHLQVKAGNKQRECLVNVCGNLVGLEGQS